MKCIIYPCFDITCGRIERDKKGKIRWFCGGFSGCGRAGSKQPITVVEKFSEKARTDKIKFSDSDNEGAQAAIKKMRAFSGLGSEFAALGGADKKTAFEIEAKSGFSNIGILSCLLRDVVIAFSHGSGFRPPSLPEVLLACKGKIIGEQTNAGKILYEKAEADEIVLPPIPFPEITGKNVCSGSPAPALDAWLRKKISVKEGDATLLLGFDLNIKREVSEKIRSRLLPASVGERR